MRGVLNNCDSKIQVYKVDHDLENNLQFHHFHSFQGKNMSGRGGSGGKVRKVMTQAINLIVDLLKTVSHRSITFMYKIL
jgi:hypothetical protein